MALWQSILTVLLSDDNDMPNWCPIELFTISDGQVPRSWKFASFLNDGLLLQAVWGYEELVADEAHYDALLERNRAALQIFHQRAQAEAE